jgi:dipeptidyl aminopeptidase/acylaminoacyl peptidase
LNGAGVRIPGQNATGMTRRTLRIDDLPRFQIPGQVEISRTGDWIAALVRWADEGEDRWRTRMDVIQTGAGTGPGMTISDDGAGCPCWSPVGDLLAYVDRGPGDRSGESILIWSARTGTAQELLTGLSRVSHLSWSPSGQELLFTATAEDESPIDVRSRPRVYRSGGDASDIAGSGRRLYLADALTGESRALTDGLSDTGAPSWSPDGRAIGLISTRPAGGTSARIELMDPSDGTVRRIGRWSGSIAWTGWLSDGRLIFAGQEKDGPCQRASLYAVDPPSGQIEDLLAEFDRRILSSGNGSPPAAVVLDSSSVLFSAYEGGCAWVYRLDLEDRSVQPWLSGAATVVQGISLSADRMMLALVMGDASSCGEIFVSATAAANPRAVTDLNSWARATAVTVPEEISFAGPGGPLHGYLLRGRPAGQSGATLIDIHGGPDRVWRPSLSPYHLYRQALVDLGWNVLLLNPRGSDGYGTEFMRSPLGRLGFSEEADFLHAVDVLIERGLADEGRLALMGSSHGGFMTNWLTARTDRFATGVSMAGVANWTSLYGTSSLGTTAVPVLMDAEPWVAPSRYAECSPLTYAHGVTVPTLLIHGENDLMNPVGQSEEWCTALRQVGVEVEFVRYPGAGHLFIYNGRISHQLDYMDRAVQWLQRQVGQGDAA